MGKKCIIYYGTVVDSGGFRWARQDSHFIEPIKVEGRDPMGKETEFCCDELRDEMNNYNLFSYDFHCKKQMSLQMASSNHLSRAIRFCPFCSARIIFREDMKLKVLETTHSVSEYHFEEYR